jgi:hypothetical protein
VSQSHVHWLLCFVRKIADSDSSRDLSLRPQTSHPVIPTYGNMLSLERFHELLDNWKCASESERAQIQADLSSVVKELVALGRDECDEVMLLEQMKISYTSRQRN